METNKGIEALNATTRKQWRNWLQKNGQSRQEICLIVYRKNSKTPGLNYAEAVEEALCFGWIDSLTNKRDGESFYQRFSPRKATSNWSERNVARVERMIKEGLMTEHGQQLIDIAKQKGKWPATIAA